MENRTSKWQYNQFPRNKGQKRVVDPRNKGEAQTGHPNGTHKVFPETGRPERNAAEPANKGEAETGHAKQDTPNGTHKDFRAESMKKKGLPRFEASRTHLSSKESTAESVGPSM